MNTATSTVEIQDHEYLRHGAQALGLRLYRPSVSTPVPVVVNLHGGAWNRGGLGECEPRDMAVAHAGVASAAIDFRQGSDGYPSSLQDIHFAIRWLRAHAKELGLDAERIAMAGQSSGGHLAMLLAMRPTDSRYGAIDGGLADVDARVACVAMNWPVINPLSRYRYALRLRGSGESHAWTKTIPEQHDTYWGNEAAMAEGNPMLALERGESVLTPPAIWIQGRPDPVHDYRDIDSGLDANEPERFARRYREAGGMLEVAYIGQSDRASGCLAPLAQFLTQQLLGNT